jgi:D-3-phosphoglycerate dehydrogenase
VRFRVLITDRFDTEAMAKLSSAPGIEVRKSTDPTPSLEELEWAQGLVIRSRTKINATVLAQAKQIEVIVTATSGFDHIDLTAIAARPKLAVMHTPSANAASAAELTWALVLSCARRLTEAHHAVKTENWRREALIGTELNGKVYGVIGLGRIGSRVAHIAQAFGMKVIAYDPYLTAKDFASASATSVGLDEIFRLAKAISVHVPATRETHHLIGTSQFQASASSPIFVNTSRGTVVDEKVLVEALRQSWIGACGLDVFEHEPLSRLSPLTQFNNVVLSPHIGATTLEAFRLASLEAAQKILDFSEHRTIVDRLPPQEAWARKI